MTTSSDRRVVTIALLTPNRLNFNNRLSYNYVASASTMAIAAAKKRGYLKNLDIKYFRARLNYKIIVLIRVNYTVISY
jgi:hypothetical protein